VSGQQQPRWQVFRDSAAAAMARRADLQRQAETAAAGAEGPPVSYSGARAGGRAALSGLGHRARDAFRRRPTVPASPQEQRRRTDLRLVPTALLVWGAAATGEWMQPAALAALSAGLAAAAAILLLSPVTRTGMRMGIGAGARVRASARGQSRAGARVRALARRPRTGPRSFRATLAVALLLSCAAAAHSAVASAQRNDGAIAKAIAARASVVAEVGVTGMPRRLSTPGRSGTSDRWAVHATVRALVFDGRRATGSAKLLILGGKDWEHATPGQRFRATGRLSPAGAGEAEAGVLSASSAPQLLRTAAGWKRVPAGLRSGFTAAAAHLPGDARGLLPGMVTGDTVELDPGLVIAMKTVGMTHLTAVSGANCSLVLGALLLGARSLRLPRWAAASFALAGLGLFVLMVGPDASVLRAALMGAIGLAALAFGRSGRGLSLLCVASTGLLLADPALATDFGFVLSVLATLGIVVAGRPIMGWLPAVVPRWMAAGLAVPLSAQVFCGPVIVLLQPQLASYALPANLAAAALVAPVTLLGTAAVPLVPLVPAVAAIPIVIAGTFAAGVAGIARCFAALPGAALPWPEGAFGAGTMVLLSGLTLSGVWLATHPAGAVGLVLKIHDRTVRGLTLVWRRHEPPRGAIRDPRRPGRCGLVERHRRGRLRVCKFTFRRNPQWLLPRPNAPGPRPRRPPPGAM